VKVAFQGFHSECSFDFQADKQAGFPYAPIVSGASEIQPVLFLKKP
jgi:hypothetical protein